MEMQQLFLSVLLKLRHYQQYENTEGYTELLLWRIYTAENDKTYFVLHVKCPKYLSDLTKLGDHRQIIIKVPSIEFQVNSFSRIYAATPGEGDRQTDIQAVVTEGTGAPSEYVDASKMARASKHNPLEFFKCF